MERWIPKKDDWSDNTWINNEKLYGPNINFKKKNCKKKNNGHRVRKENHCGSNYYDLLQFGRITDSYLFSYRFNEITIKSIHQQLCDVFYDDNNKPYKS